jgi:hypothetical protein
MKKESVVDELHTALYDGYLESPVAELPIMRPAYEHAEETLWTKSI